MRNTLNAEEKLSHLLIQNATIFVNDDDNSIWTGHAVAVEGSNIREVGPEREMLAKYAHFNRIDARGRLLMPGLVNAHNHFYSTFARGLSLPQQPKNFAEILAMLWWKLDSALDSDAVFYSALLPAITAVRKGVTGVIDHHASPNAVDGSLDRIEEALAKVGLRAVLCYEVSDRDGKDIAEKGLRENARYIRKCRAAKNANSSHLFDGMMGLHASFTLENATLERAAASSVALQRGCHIHVLEDGVDQVKTLERFQTGAIDRLRKFGILGDRAIAAHCIHLTEEQKDTLAQTKAMVVHNPQSNMNNAVGRTDVMGLLQRGVVLGIGTDGMTQDIKADIRAANLLHKHDLKNSNVGWNEIQKAALKNNYAIFRKVSNQPVGQIARGYLADLILVDYFPPTDLTGDNFWGHFLFGIADAEVDTTIIGGRIVMQNKELPGIDERQIAHEAWRVAQGVWERFYS